MRTVGNAAWHFGHAVSLRLTPQRFFRAVPTSTAMAPTSTRRNTVALRVAVSIGTATVWLGCLTTRLSGRGTRPYTRHFIVHGRSNR